MGRNLSTLLKDNLHTVKASLLVECARSVKYRGMPEHCVLGGICCVITELLFVTYFVDDKDDDWSIYSDSAIVCRYIPKEYSSTARNVIAYRNKFTHEFGSTEYWDLYNIVSSDMTSVLNMLHEVGGVCTKKEREEIKELLGIEDDEFYDATYKLFMDLGPIGYKRLLAKLQRNHSSGNTIRSRIERAGG